ncbi:MAG: sugar phosphorylase [Bacteroidota bacterium]
MNTDTQQHIQALLAQVYPAEQVDGILQNIIALVNHYQSMMQRDGVHQLSEKDVVLITYGDQVWKEGEYPLATLKRFMDEQAAGLINAVHILPFYPYSSDDGFSVIDYYEVNPEWGSWETIADLASGYHLMFDGVINHISQESEWFKQFLAGDPRYGTYFIEDDPNKDYSKVVRPRVLPLLHDYEDANGQTRYVWTTFSRDQVDLNYRNPQVLLQVIDLLLFYAMNGASLIRLDAIGFMWKEDDSTCIHLPQTHNLIKVMRAAMAEAVPDLIFITETNVPHLENISYFGNGYDEAQMVYNFTLPPLLAYSLLNGTSEKFTAWAQSLELPSNEVCFFNFTASHDGVGLRPVTGILDETEVEVLLTSAKANGGKVSYKTDADGGQSPYEINCNYLSLLCGAEKDIDQGTARMILSQAVMLAFPGLPAIYFHSLVGSQNDVEGMERSGQNRRINREKLNYDQLVDELGGQAVRKAVWSAVQQLLRVRQQSAAFHPFGSFRFHNLSPSLISIQRFSPDKQEEVWLLFNLTTGHQEVHLPSGTYADLLHEETAAAKQYLRAYEYRWLRKKV